LVGFEALPCVVSVPSDMPLVNLLGYFWIGTTWEVFDLYGCRVIDCLILSKSTEVGLGMKMVGDNMTIDDSEAKQQSSNGNCIMTINNNTIQGNGNDIMTATML